MKKNVLRSVAYFLVGIFVMEMLFTGTSKNVNASHSETSKLIFANNMVIKSQYKKVDSSLPAPFNKGCTSLNHCFFVKESGKNTYSTCYCIGYDKRAYDKDNLKSNMKLDDLQARLLNYSMNYGFNKKDFNIASGTTSDVNHYFATQTLIWFIRADIFFNDAARTKTENFFYKVWPGIQNNYKTIYEKVKYQEMAPSYVNNTEYVLKWNASTSKYELTLENTYKSGSNSANKTVKIDKSSLPSGVTAKVEGEKIIFSSTNEITSAKTIKITKAPEVKGRLVAWNNAISSRQPQISLDYDEDPIKKVMEIKIKTNKKPSQPTPEPTQTPTVAPTQTPTQTPTVAPTQTPTVEPTQTPTVVPTQTPTVAPTQTPTVVPTQTPTGEATPEPTVEVTETPVQNPENNVVEQKVYEKEVKASKLKEMDESPKTADESKLELALQLLGASGIAMLLTGITVLIKRRKTYKF